MRAKKVKPMDITSEADMSIVAVLERLKPEQETYDEVCSKLPHDLLGFIARLVIRLNGNLLCEEGKRFHLFNGDRFVEVPLWAVVWGIENLLAEGLLREAALFSVSREKLNTLADKVGVERTDIKGKTPDKALALIRGALLGSATLPPTDVVTILTEINSLAENSVSAKISQASAKKVRDGSTFSALLRQLPQARGIYQIREDLNADGTLLVCKGGITLDLQKIATPELMARASTQFDLNTFCSNAVYNPQAICPKFATQFEHIFDDLSARDFARLLLGTCVDGSQPKELMLILHGPPGTGKSVLVWAVANALGDYATAVDGSFCLKNTSRGKGDATPQYVKIIGKRLIVASEPDGGAMLDEAMLKTLTGDAKITYRDLYSSEKDFVPVGTIVMTANRLPRLSGDDSAITNRRLATYQCRGQIAYDQMKDTATFNKELEQENSGILNFLLEGYLGSTKFARLPIPSIIREELRQYQHTHDIAEQFFSEMGIVSDMHSSEKGVSVADLYKKYTSWCESNGNTHPLSTNRFTPLLVSKGFKQAIKQIQGKNTRVWLGIQLSAPTNNSAPSTNGHVATPSSASPLDLELDLQEKF